MMKLKLYNYYRSSASFRVRIALELKGLDYEYAPIHLARGEHKQPAFAGLVSDALVPMLQVSSAQGGSPLHLSQSLAILEYLEEAYPEPALLPSHAAERAQVRAMALMVACEIHPLNNLRVLKYLTQQLQVSEQDKNTWYQHWVREGLQSLEKQLTTLARGPFCFGHTPGLADCFLVPQIFNARRFNVNLDGLPRVMSTFDACMALPAFQRAQPSQCPDYEP